MKKIFVAGLVAAVVVAVCPWWLGGVAVRRLDHVFQSLPERASYLRIAQDKWTNGWLRSEQDVTFELVLPGINPRTPVMHRGSQDARGMLKAAATQQIPNAVPLRLPKSLRFTVHNIVLHGPLLGTSGIGLARVESRLVLSDAVRGKLMDILGTDEPIHVISRLGFFGGSTTTLSGEGRKAMLSKINPAAGDSSIAWDDFRLTTHVSSGAEGYDISGRQPKLEISNTKSALNTVASDITVKGSGKRITKDLYDGGVTLGIGKLTIAYKSQDVEVDALEYATDSDRKGDFLNSGIKIGAGEIHDKMLEAFGIQLKQVHFDFSLRHLHLDTLQTLMTALRDTDRRPDGVAGQAGRHLRHSGRAGTGGHVSRWWGRFRVGRGQGAAQARRRPAGQSHRISAGRPEDQRQGTAVATGSASAGHAAGCAAARALTKGPAYVAGRVGLRRRRAKRSVALRSARAMPGSKAEWPASGTTMSSASGQARCRCQALRIGQTTS